MITGKSHQTDKHFVMKLISLTVGNYKSVSRQLQNYTVNGAMSITINRLIKEKNTALLQATFRGSER